MLNAGVYGQGNVIALGLDARQRVHHVGEAGIMLLAAQGVVVGRLDAGGAELLRGVAHDVGRQGAGRVLAPIAAVFLAH